MDTINKIQNAIRFATKTHEIYQKQKRKGKDVAYITHPLTVGLLLSRIGVSDDVVCVGILHDTMEDSIPEKKATGEMLAEKFGQNVAELVLSVTEPDKTLSWEERKKEALEHVKNFSHESLLVKSADIISNMSELLEDYKSEGENVWTRFNAPKEKLLINTNNLILAILERWPESALAPDLAEVRIQLTRIEALGAGPLAYMEWSISFIEYEMERIFQDSKVKSEVLNLCEDMHKSIGEYRVNNDVGLLDKKLTKILSELHQIITAIEKDEFGPYFLLITHVADIMANMESLRMLTNRQLSISKK